MTTRVVSAEVDGSRDLGSMTGDPGWLVVAGQECRDLWRSGRGLALLFCLSVLLSAVTYLASTNSALNFLERREAVNLVLQFVVGVGVLLTLVVTADGISGERERETLESLLVTPVSRRAILAGKLIAGLTLWFAAYVVSIPYLWLLARGRARTGLRGAVDQYRFQLQQDQSRYQPVLTGDLVCPHTAAERLACGLVLRRDRAAQPRVVRVGLHHRPAGPSGSLE
jgi:hypothetical protein